MAVNYVIEKTPVSVLGNSNWGSQDVGFITTNSTEPTFDNYSSNSDGLVDGGTVPIKMVIKPQNPATHTVSAASFNVRGIQYNSVEVSSIPMNGFIWVSSQTDSNGNSILPDSVVKVMMSDSGVPNTIGNTVIVLAWLSEDSQIPSVDTDIFIDIDGDADLITASAGAPSYVSLTCPDYVREGHIAKFVLHYQNIPSILDENGVETGHQTRYVGFKGSKGGTINTGDIDYQDIDAYTYWAGDTLLWKNNGTSSSDTIGWDGVCNESVVDSLTTSEIQQNAAMTDHFMQQPQGFRIGPTYPWESSGVAVVKMVFCEGAFEDDSGTFEMKLDAYDSQYLSTGQLTCETQVWDTDEDPDNPGVPNPGQVSMTGPCTDPTASNYNPNAIVCFDNFSNGLTGGLVPFMDNTFFEQEAGLMMWQNEYTAPCHTCEYEGCMDINAVNFDQYAQTDDGSCYYGTVGVSFPIKISVEPDSNLNISAFTGNCLGETNEQGTSFTLGPSTENTQTIFANLGSGGAIGSTTEAFPLITLTPKDGYAVARYNLWVEVGSIGSDTPPGLDGWFSDSPSVNSVELVSQSSGLSVGIPVGPVPNGFDTNANESVLHHLLEDCSSCKCYDGVGSLIDQGSSIFQKSAMFNPIVYQNNYNENTSTAWDQGIFNASQSDVLSNPHISFTDLTPMGTSSYPCIATVVPDEFANYPNNGIDQMPCSSAASVGVSDAPLGYTISQVDDSPYSLSTVGIFNSYKIWEQHNDGSITNACNWIGNKVAVRISDVLYYFVPGSNPDINEIEIKIKGKAFSIQDCEDSVIINGSLSIDG